LYSSHVDFEDIVLVMIVCEDCFEIYWKRYWYAHVLVLVKCLVFLYGLFFFWFGLRGVWFDFFFFLDNDSLGIHHFFFTSFLFFQLCFFRFVCVMLLSFYTWCLFLWSCKQVIICLAGFLKYFLFKNILK
jgi:hypothetical protein